MSPPSRIWVGSGAFEEMLGFRVWGLGFGVWGLGFGVWGSLFFPSQVPLAQVMLAAAHDALSPNQSTRVPRPQLQFHV